MKSRRWGLNRHISKILDMKFISIENMRCKFADSNQFSYFQIRESLSPINNLTTSPPHPTHPTPHPAYPTPHPSPHDSYCFCKPFCCIKFALRWKSIQEPLRAPTEGPKATLETTRNSKRRAPRRGPRKVCQHKQNIEPRKNVLQK